MTAMAMSVFRHMTTSFNNLFVYMHPPLALMIAVQGTIHSLALKPNVSVVNHWLLL